MCNLFLAAFYYSAPCCPQLYALIDLDYSTQAVLKYSGYSNKPQLAELQCIEDCGFEFPQGYVQCWGYLGGRVGRFIPSGNLGNAGDTNTERGIVQISTESTTLEYKGLYVLLCYWLLEGSWYNWYCHLISVEIEASSNFHSF